MGNVCWIYEEIWRNGIGGLRAANILKQGLSWTLKSYKTTLKMYKATLKSYNESLFLHRSLRFTISCITSSM